jgi:hypothetical protein
MGYKYKLPPKLTPDTLQAMGAEVDLYARKKFVTTPANTEKSMNLENTIRYSLEDANFSSNDIDNYIELLYIERNNNVGGEFSDTPLNEKEEGYYSEKVGKDEEGEDILKIHPGSLQTSLDAKLKSFKDEKDPEFKFDPKAKNTFKTLEELGKAKLAQEVLRRLRNR